MNFQPLEISEACLLAIVVDVVVVDVVVVVVVVIVDIVVVWVIYLKRPRNLNAVVNSKY